MLTGKGPKIETIRGLLENCGNQCAFPGCNHPILNRKNQFIAKLVLIEDDPSAGGRFDPEAEETIIHRPENLMFLCYRHYIETSDPEIYPKEILGEIKRNHELSPFVNTNSRFSLNAINEIQSDLGIANQIEQYDVGEVFPQEKPVATDEDSDVIRPAAYKKGEGKIKSIKRFDPPKISKKEATAGEKKIDEGQAQQMEAQFVELKQSVDKLLKLVGNVHKSDMRLNRDLKTLIESIDILGIFTWRFRQLPFTKNPFINRNHETIHVMIPQTTNKLKEVIKELEMNVLGKLAEDIPGKQEEIKEKLVSLQTRSRIIVKNIRYADKVS